MANNEVARISGHPVCISHEYACDVLTTAVEGGSNYWAKFIDVERDSELSVLRVRFTVPGGVKEEGDEAKVYTVRASDLQDAVRKMLDPSLKMVNKEIQSYIVQDDNDAWSSDAILQVAAFGEVVFG